MKKTYKGVMVLTTKIAMSYKANIRLGNLMRIVFPEKKSVNMNKGCLEIQFLVYFLNVTLERTFLSAITKLKPLASQFLYSDVTHGSKQDNNVIG